MSGKRKHTLCIAALAAVLLASGGGLAAQLEIDYIPPLVYKGDPATLLVRAANAEDRPVEFLLSARTTQPGEANARLTTGVPVTVGPGQPQSLAIDLPWAWSAAEVTLLADGQPTGSLVLRGFDEDGDIPPLVARAGRLMLAEDGTPVVLFLTQRSAQSDREWVIWKRLARSLERRLPPTGVAVVGSTFGSSEKPRYLHILSQVTSPAVSVHALPGVSGRMALQPILADLASAMRAFDGLKQTPQMVVWVVDSSDARRAASVWNFRKAADLILHRARRVGAGRVGVLFVPEPGVSRGSLDAYAAQLREASAVYRAEFAVLDDLANPINWRAERGSALLRSPNHEGHETLARLILDAVRP